MTSQAEYEVEVAHAEALEIDQILDNQATFGDETDRMIAKGLWLRGGWSLRDIAVLFEVVLHLDVKTSTIALWQMEDNWPPRPKNVPA